MYAFNVSIFRSEMFHRKCLTIFVVRRYSRVCTFINYFTEISIVYQTNTITITILTTTTTAMIEKRKCVCVRRVNGIKQPKQYYTIERNNIVHQFHSTPAEMEKCRELLVPLGFSVCSPFAD